MHVESLLIFELIDSLRPSVSTDTSEITVPSVARSTILAPSSWLAEFAHTDLVRKDDKSSTSLILVKYGRRGQISSLRASGSVSCVDKKPWMIEWSDFFDDSTIDSGGFESTPAQWYKNSDINWPRCSPWSCCEYKSASFNSDNCDFAALWIII